MSPRDVGARALLDPRWHWLRTALSRLYAEVDDGASPESLSVIVEDGSELVAYTVARGVPEVDRRVVVSLEGVTEAVLNATIDANPGDVP